jgi:hypothetical protein
MLTAIMDGKFKTKSTRSLIFIDKCRLTLSLVAFARLRTKIWLGGLPKYSITFVQLAFCSFTGTPVYPFVNINLWRSYHLSSTYDRSNIQYDFVLL